MNSVQLGNDRRELERNVDELVGHGMLDEEELQVFVDGLIGAGLVEWIGGTYRCDEDLDFAETWSDWYHE